MSNSRKLAYLLPAAFALASTLLIAPTVFAHEEDSITVNANANVRAGVGGASAQATVGATGTAKMNNATSTPRENKATTTGTTMRAEHQSTVAARVQALLSAADRDGGIGPEVRLIAREHASSSQTIEEAEDEVENRPGWLTFLFGSDYGNLGKLRSEIVTVQNQIARLENAAGRSADATVKADLEAQVAALKAQASTTMEFVEENEDSFSLFGWMVKIFN